MQQTRIYDFDSIPVPVERLLRYGSYSTTFPVFAQPLPQRFLIFSQAMMGTHRSSHATSIGNAYCKSNGIVE